MAHGVAIGRPSNELTPFSHCLKVFSKYLCKHGAQTAAALHHGAPGQMTWMEDPPPWLKPWLRPA